MTPGDKIGSLLSDIVKKGGTEEFVRALTSLTNEQKDKLIKIHNEWYLGGTGKSMYEHSSGILFINLLYKAVLNEENDYKREV